MIETIWKYLLQPGHNMFEVPAHSHIVHVGCDPNGDPAAWYQVVEGVETREEELMVVGTGHDFDGKAWEYHSSIHQGPFVWHVLTVMG